MRVGTSVTLLGRIPSDLVGYLVDSGNAGRDKPQNEEEVE